MLDIEDKSRQPSMGEISVFISNSLFDCLCMTMADEYAALIKIVYSCDKILLGWNVKFKKGGRTLCTFYPRRGFFHMLLVVGPKEAERVEALLPSCSREFREVYSNTKEGMGQRWMLFDFTKRTPDYDDALRVIRIRRQST